MLSTVSTVLEREVKYDVPTHASLPDLRGLAGVDHTEAGEPVLLLATYYDTADLALARAGVTLRRRTGGPDAGWQLKLPRGDARLELQVADSAGGPPTQLREEVRDLVGERPLAAIAHIKTSRQTTRLLDRDDSVLAEICDDYVASACSGQPEVLTWREWELKAGDPAVAEAARMPFMRAGARRSRSRSNLVRALRFRSNTRS